MIAQSNPETKGTVNNPFRAFNLPVMQRKAAVKKLDNKPQVDPRTQQNTKVGQKIETPIKPTTRPTRPGAPIFNPQSTPVTKQ